MPAPKEVSHSTVYRSLRNDSRQLGENRDCAVVAVAAAVDVPYEQVHKRMADLGRRPGRGTDTMIIEAALKSYGCSLWRIHRGELADRFIAHYPEPHRSKLKNVTTHHPDRFRAYWPNGTFLLYTAGHVLCVRDGENHDWTRGTATRVIAALEVRQ